MICITSSVIASTKSPPNLFVTSTLPSRVSQPAAGPNFAARRTYTGMSDIGHPAPITYAIWVALRAILNYYLISTTPQAPVMRRDFTEPAVAFATLVELLRWRAHRQPEQRTHI